MSFRNIVCVSLLGIVAMLVAVIYGYNCLSPLGTSRLVLWVEFGTLAVMLVTGTRNPAVRCAKWLQGRYLATSPLRQTAVRFVLGTVLNVIVVMATIPLAPFADLKAKNDVRIVLFYLCIIELVFFNIFYYIWEFIDFMVLLGKEGRAKA